MFTYVKAKNFKSFKDINFNLNMTKNKTNPFIVIYGENGSGKTHIVELFSFLQQVEQGDIALQKRYRMIGETEPTEIEYGFKTDNKDGYYYIKFDDNKILDEKLYFKIGRQKSAVFQIRQDENEIEKVLNKNVFINQSYKEELEEIIDKYWGKYTFLSLLLKEMTNKDREYMEKSILLNNLGIVFEILSILVKTGKFNSASSEFNLNIMLTDVRRGAGNVAIKKIIAKYEEVLNIFFTQAYADIKKVKYKLEQIEDTISYRLYFYKMIGGTLREIPANLESTGTQRLLEMFNELIGAVLGRTVVIDEIDNGIHDLLMKNIIMSIKDEITGQLIITTHNTLLLEVLPKDCVYILAGDCDGNKEIYPITDYSVSHNTRDSYLKGLFGGTPNTDYVDFDGIKYAFENIV